MRAPIEVKRLREEHYDTIEQLKSELAPHKGAGEIRDDILADIGQEVITIQLLDWVLEERDEP